MALFPHASAPEGSRIAHILREETTGGLLLILAAIAAMIWAGVDGSGYAHIQETRLGGGWLDLTLAQWASDGLLAIFFFVAGLELKREFLLGTLRSPRRAAVPVAAAVAGMVVPAAIFTAIHGPDRGWAIPIATDIAFAVAVLAVISAHLPSGLRTFLLTLAVVDDLLAIIVIALFYTDHLRLVWLALAVLPLLAWRAATVRGLPIWILAPLALAVWILVLRSGIHPTVAGVALAFVAPVGRADAYDHALRPVSAGIAVPTFAFLAAGVSLGGLGDAVSDTVALGIVAGLVIGKTVGIFGGTWLVARFTHAELDPDLSWRDVIGVGLLGGIGFTVSLLIGELAYAPGHTLDHVRMAVPLGSLVAALAATLVLRRSAGSPRRTPDRIEEPGATAERDR